MPWYNGCRRGLCVPESQTRCMGKHLCGKPWTLTDVQTRGCKHTQCTLRCAASHTNSTLRTDPASSPGKQNPLFPCVTPDPAPRGQPTALGGWGGINLLHLVPSRELDVLRQHNMDTTQRCCAHRHPSPRYGSLRSMRGPVPAPPSITRLLRWLQTASCVHRLLCAPPSLPTLRLAALDAGPRLRTPLK